MATATHTGSTTRIDLTEFQADAVRRLLLWEAWFRMNCTMCGYQTRTHTTYLGVCENCRQSTNDDDKQDREDTYTGHPIPRRA